MLIKVTGYGPRAAEKRMQMLVSSFAFDYTANAAITLRSADSGLDMSVFSVATAQSMHIAAMTIRAGQGFLLLL